MATCLPLVATRNDGKWDPGGLVTDCLPSIRPAYHTTLARISHKTDDQIGPVWSIGWLRLSWCICPPNLQNVLCYQSFLSYSFHANSSRLTNVLYRVANGSIRYLWRVSLTGPWTLVGVLSVSAIWKVPTRPKWFQIWKHKASSEPEE